VGTTGGGEIPHFLKHYNRYCKYFNPLLERKQIIMTTLKLATLLLQVFGYINATEEDVILLQTTNAQRYILVEFCQKYITFSFTNNKWSMIEE